jgi:RNA polymerase sigma-70 factor (ECF subfamily)
VWSLSDEALLAGFASEDPEAAVAFVRRFQGRVYGLALTILRDAHAAEDIAQETFIRALRGAGAYDVRKGRVSTWLLTIARNASVDLLRVRRSDPMDPEALIALEVPDDDQSHDPAVAADERRRVQRAISTLPIDQRRALVMAAFFGYTAREISLQEDVPLGTVKTRVRTAMLKLRSALEVSDER